MRCLYESKNVKGDCNIFNFTYDWLLYSEYRGLLYLVFTENKKVDFTFRKQGQLLLYSQISQMVLLDK